MMSNGRRMTARTRLIHRQFVLLLSVIGLAAGTLHIEPAPAASGLVGQPAPDFGLPAIAGSNVRLSEYRGQPVILTFWGSRCGDCEKQLAALNHLHATYRTAGLVTLGISVDDSDAHAEQYAHAHAVSYPMLLDRSKSVSRVFQIDRLPTTLMIDRSGIVRYIHAGDSYDERLYVTQIRKLLDDDIAVP